MRVIYWKKSWWLLCLFLHQLNLCTTNTKFNKGIEFLQMRVYSIPKREKMIFYLLLTTVLVNDHSLITEACKKLFLRWEKWLMGLLFFPKCTRKHTSIIYLLYNKLNKMFTCIFLIKNIKNVLCNKPKKT